MITNKYEVSNIELRPAVKWFAEQMELTLRANDHKGPDGWVFYEYTGEFIDRLREETAELENAIGLGKDVPAVIGEAADVANFAMMIADVYLRRKG